MSVKLFATPRASMLDLDDQDGYCEIHCNTMEGIWVGVRNFLRPFRGIHKKYLYLYVAMFEWSYNSPIQT